MTKRKPAALKPATAAAALAAYDTAVAAHDTAADDLDMASERYLAIRDGGHSPEAKEGALALKRAHSETEMAARVALNKALDGIEPFLAHEDETVQEMRERLGLAA